MERIKMETLFGKDHAFFKALDLIPFPPFYVKVLSHVIKTGSIRPNRDHVLFDRVRVRTYTACQVLESHGILTKAKLGLPSEWETLNGQQRASYRTLHGIKKGFENTLIYTLNHYGFRNIILRKINDLESFNTRLIESHLLSIKNLK